MADAFNPYELLEVAHDADLETIEKAYRRAAQRAHPDREGGSTERMQALNEAWEILKDPERRRRFDLTGDRTAEDPTVRAARGVLENMVGILIRNSEPDLNLIEALAQGIEKQRQGCREEREKTRTQIQALEQRLMRLRGPKSGNFIRKVIELEIGKGKERLPIYDADERVLEKALELLKDYAWVSAWTWASPTLLQPVTRRIIPPFSNG
jgi:curved DNA-binding protein CbpA